MTRSHNGRRGPPADPGPTRGRGGLLVYLVNPWQHVVAEGSYTPPPSDCLGMNYVASAMREAGYSVATCDAYVTRMQPEAIADDALRKADGRGVFLGFSFMCPSQLPHAELIVQRLREAGARLVHVTAGGQFAATSHGSLLREFPDTYDSMVYGEADTTARKLIDAVVAQQVWQDVPGVASRDGASICFERRRELPDLRAVPWPARDALPALVEHDGVVNIDTSRGCESSCIFCMSREILRHTATRDRWRSRSPKDVVDEIEWIHRTSGLRRFNFTDENTIGNRHERSRILELADEFEARGLDIRFNAYIRAQDVDEELLRRLHEVGLASVFIGVESFWQPTLDRLNKGIDVAANLEAIRTVRRVDGLRFYFGLMTFHPWVTLEEIRFNVETLRREVLGIPLTGPEILKRLLQVLLIYKGTPSYKLAKRDGLITKEARFDQGLCPYHLPEQARKLLRFIKRALGCLLQPQHEAFLVWSAPEHQADADLVARLHELNVRVDAAILDATDRFIRALEAEADQPELDRIFDETRAQATDLAAELQREVAMSVRGVGPVDQPDEVFLREAERLGA
jgi:hypothetical protein